jgi:hypothetical protein
VNETILNITDSPTVNDPDLSIKTTEESGDVFSAWYLIRTTV